MPLIRRLPKRGFTNIFSKNIETVNVGDLERLPEGTVVTPEVLVQHRMIRRGFDGVKVLGNGELETKLVVQAHAFSASAKTKIEGAGGRAEELKA
jgi:large subunit ribosomal protein L15